MTLYSPLDADDAMPATRLPVLVEPQPAPSGRAAQHSLFGPRAQGAFLASLQLFGNVRLACQAACVSTQTAYRSRRASPPLARAWDAALLAARTHAEAELADRALNGVEEAVFYHGEEVARRRRFDGRLLLAHLARLDRLAARPEVEDELARLDASIDALERGEDLPLDPAPPAPSRMAAAGQTLSASNSADDEDEGEEAFDDEAYEWECGWADDPRYERYPQGSHKHRLPPPAYPEWEADMDDPAHWLRGEYIPPLGRLLRAMDAARPAEVTPVYGAVGALQMEAFTAGLPDWWMIESKAELAAALAAAGLVGAG